MLVVLNALKVQLASALLTVVVDDARIQAAIKGQETSFSVLHTEGVNDVLEKGAQSLLSEARTFALAMVEGEDAPSKAVTNLLNLRQSFV
mmetsp:Transcript_32494/g.58791  ORF Transcript_32494/g.58791 Transcript_32494/m.58791 type:complete len:90 (-) Transcript_32494:2451-2720(-)